MAFRAGFGIHANQFRRLDVFLFANVVDPLLFDFMTLRTSPFVTQTAFPLLTQKASTAVFRTWTNIGDGFVQQAIGMSIDVSTGSGFFDFQQANLFIQSLQFSLYVLGVFQEFRRSFLVVDYFLGQWKHERFLFLFQLNPFHFQLFEKDGGERLTNETACPFTQAFHAFRGGLTQQIGAATFGTGGVLTIGTRGGDT